MIRAVTALLALLLPAMATACVLSNHDTEASLCTATLKAPAAVTGRFAGPVHAIRSGALTSALSLTFVAARWQVGSGAARITVIYPVHPEDGAERTRDHIESLIRTGASQLVYFSGQRGEAYVIGGSPVFCGTPLVFAASNAEVLIAARQRPSLCRSFKRR